MVNTTDAEGTTKAKMPLSAQYQKLAIQGLDPLVDERIGLRFFVRFGGKGVTPVPGFVADLLRTHVWPKLVNDPEMNCVFMDRVFLWTFVLAPLFLYLLLFADYENNKLWFACCYIAYFAVWFDQFVSYVLALHCVVHRSIFKTTTPAGRALKTFFVWFLGPMLGETPETYNAHHVHMHHPMNNGYDDLSTTLTYRRDSGWDFFRYFCRFFVVHFELWGQLSKRNPIVAKRFVTGELCWMGVGLLLYQFRPFAVALLYVLPIIILRFGMTAGNWGQHAFINKANPFINTNQSASIMNSLYNTVAFNDGYHIQHHEHAVAPYYELPLLWVQMLPQMAENDSIVFDAKGGRSGAPVFDWVSLWFLLMTGQYDVLADHFVDCRAIVNKTAPRPKAEIVAMLKERTRPVYDRETTPPPKAS